MEFSPFLQNTHKNVQYFSKQHLNNRKVIEKTTELAIQFQQYLVYLKKHI